MSYDDWLEDAGDLEEGTYTCPSPGRRGCGECDACLEWADIALDRDKDGDW